MTVVLPMDRVRVLMPVYQDWDAVRQLLPLLDRAFEGAGARVSVYLVDDCSSVSPGARLFDGPARARFAAIDEVRIVRLRRNVGHQRAIAIGLCCLDADDSHAPVVVMDADGEDLPADVPRLTDALVPGQWLQVVFAKRTRRSEGLVFTTFYRLYRWTHHALTGMSVQVGNFSVLSHGALRSIVVSSDIWNHYAAAVVKARIPSTLVPTARGTRLAGRSTMNFASLVSHGLSAMSVFSERIGVRLLIVASGLLGLLLVALAATIAVRLFTTLAIPGWATTAGGLLVVLILQILMLAFVFGFMIQQGRSAASFIPTRDYRYFVDEMLDVPLARAPEPAHH